MSEPALPSLQSLSRSVSRCMRADQHVLRRKLSQLKRQQQAGKAITDQLLAIHKRVEASLARVKLRQQQLPEVKLNSDLPIFDDAEKIKQLIKDNQVVVLAGETGSGKTTQLPQLCLQIGRGIKGMIGHTQPRRVAARTVAHRIADELSVEVGEQVAYQVRFTDQSSDYSHLKVMTDGILLAEISRDKFLTQYDTLIIDEAHERSLNIDFLLGYFKQLLPKRPDLKLIITSATIDLQRFSKHFDNAPIVEVSGRTFPVDVEYRPPHEQDDDRSAEEVNDAVIRVVEEITEQSRRGKAAQGAGGILVFLPSERDIREISRRLRKMSHISAEVLPLYARLSVAEQNKIFNVKDARRSRIILATNVAETSLTVPGIGYVIDTGLARVSRYSVRSKVQRLPIEAVSQASANQRKGRCGRTSAGVCYRIYAEEDFNARPEFTDAEVLRTNLAAVILQMLTLNMGDIANFPFVDAPENRAINDGYALLIELGAVDSKRHLTDLGRQLGKLPIDPRLGRMLIAANDNAALAEALIIVSALTLQDPRERPAEKQGAADEKHKRYWHKDSDFLALLNLWNGFEEQRQALTQNKLRRYCGDNFLSWMRMREWRDLHRQLLLACKSLGFKENSTAANYQSIHASLLSGLLGNMGNLLEKSEYLGARGRKFYIFPGSSQFKPKPKWMMVAEIVETTRLYGRMVAKIDPLWAEGHAHDLLKRRHSEARWEKKRGRAVASEKISLYGLVLVENRKVNYDRIDPVVARELLIRQGLINALMFQEGGFYKHNLALVTQLESLEHKTRRRDILVDDERLFEFYDERLPAHIVSAVGFNKWRRKKEQSQPQFLHMNQADLLRRDIDDYDAAAYPEQLQFGKLELPLKYNFEPSEDNDGVVITVPVSALNQIPEHQLDWVVPGLLEQKCQALLRALPKSLRKNFVPIPDYAKQAAAKLEVSNIPLTRALGLQLKRMTGVDVPVNQWDSSNLDKHLKVLVEVRDDKGKLLASGRDIIAIQAKLQQIKAKATAPESIQGIERDKVTRWDFGELPEQYEYRQAGVPVVAYPAIVDKITHCQIKLFDSEVEARRMHRWGLVRMYALNLGGDWGYLKKNLPKFKQLSLLYTRIGDGKNLQDQLMELCVDHCFLLGKKWPINRQQFEQNLQQHKASLLTHGLEIMQWFEQLMRKHHALATQLENTVSPALAPVYSDAHHHLQRLLYHGFLVTTPAQYLQHYPRYLDGLERRLARIQGSVNKDEANRKVWDQLYKRYLNLTEGLTPSRELSMRLEEFYWQLEELRVSLFAQGLGTPKPVSQKRLQKAWDAIELLA